MKTPDELRDFIVDFFNNKMPFNQLLGFAVTQHSTECVKIRLAWNDKLMGNPVHKILHGGATAAILDTVGSLAALVHGTTGLKDQESVSNFYHQLANGGTLNMRVDYLRPGRGEEFVASGRVVRQGSKITVCRMDLHNENGMHIATGTGTYII